MISFGFVGTIADVPTNVFAISEAIACP